MICSQGLTFVGIFFFFFENEFVHKYNIKLKNMYKITDMFDYGSKSIVQLF